MKSGLEGRNNSGPFSGGHQELRGVSMKSGLEGRNNYIDHFMSIKATSVSMKSGLEGRNNRASGWAWCRKGLGSQ